MNTSGETTSGAEGGRDGLARRPDAAIDRWLPERVETIAALIVFAWLAFRTVRVMQVGWGYTQDDAYITLRYARHLAEGHGIVWNVGEKTPVEGYSNFLFVLVGAAALEVGLDPVVCLKVLGCVAVAPTFALLYVLARRWLRPLPATLPAVLLAAQPGEVFWAVSALETTVFQLFVVAAATTFIMGLDAPLDGSTSGRWSRSRLHVLSAALCLLASLTRPEGPVVVVVLGLTALVDAAVRWLRTRDRGAVRALVVSVRAFALAFLVPYAAYFLWRYAYFGRLVPNTVYCKSVYNDKGGDPWALVHDFWEQGKVLVLLACVQDPRKLGARALPLFLLPLAYAGMLFHADPIVGQFSRHFLAAIALLAVASSLGLANLFALVTWPLRWAASGGKSGSRRTGALVLIVDAAVVASCLALYARGQAWLANDTPRACAHRFDDRDDPWRLAPPFDLAYHASCYASRMEGRAELGRYLDRALSPEQSYVLGDVGIAPYLSHASVIDAFCLNSPDMTRPPISFDRGRFLDSIFDHAPDAIVVHSWSLPPKLSPLPDYGFYPALVADPRFQRSYEPQPHAAFHAPLRGEGWYYVVYERKAK